MNSPKHVKYSKADRKKYKYPKYKLTELQYSTIRDLQNNKCAICSKTFTKTPHLDHNHSSNEIRGLLCENCNRGIGMFKDNILILKEACRYLEHGPKEYMIIYKFASETPIIFSKQVDYQKIATVKPKKVKRKIKEHHLKTLWKDAID